MRLSMLVVLAFTVVLGVLSKAPVEAQGLRAGVVSSSVSYAQDQTGAKLDVSINVNKGGGGGGKWYANPLWIAIGGLALLVLIVLIVMAARSGGTTVVKDEVMSFTRPRARFPTRALGRRSRRVTRQANAMTSFVIEAGDLYSPDTRSLALRLWSIPSSFSQPFHINP
jgi:hypothetical protein